MCATSSLTLVKDGEDAALGDPTRAILKLAPDQIRPATIYPGDVIEGDEVVGVFGPSEAQGETVARVVQK